jgi:hypothetical protein
LSEPEEVPVEKPKRRIWKIFVPLIVLVIMIPILMYVYGYVVLGDAYSKSWDTIEISDSTSPNPETWYEQLEYIEEVPINNPTGTNVRFIEVNYDCWVDGKIFVAMHESDVYLPAGGSTTLTHTTYYSSELLGSLLSDSYEVKTRREVVASTDILFLTVTRAFRYEDIETTYNVW